MLRMRRVDSPGLRRAVYELRYRAYRRDAAIAASPDRVFVDAYDLQPNHILWALTDEDRVVGSVRTTWYAPADPWAIPEQHGYAEDVASVAPTSARIFSGNRFVTDPDRPDLNAGLATQLLRFNLAAAAVGGCDWALAAVRQHHLSFYRRVLRLERISSARRYPGLDAMMYLTACRFPIEIDKVYSRTPSLRLDDCERSLLDPALASVWEDGVVLAPDVTVRRSRMSADQQCLALAPERLRLHDGPMPARRATV